MVFDSRLTWFTYGMKVFLISHIFVDPYDVLGAKVFSFMFVIFKNDVVLRNNKKNVRSSKYEDEQIRLSYSVVRVGERFCGISQQSWCFKNGCLRLVKHSQQYYFREHIRFYTVIYINEIRS